MKIDEQDRTWELGIMTMPKAKAAMTQHLLKDAAIEVLKQAESAAESAIWFEIMNRTKYYE